MRYHALQHVSFESPGLLVGAVREKGHSLEVTALFSNAPLPQTADFDALIIMGGPMSIHDEAIYPWLRAEKELIAAAIREGKKVLGICLGAQLIAAVCGARVYQNTQKEIGFWPVEWTEAAGKVFPGHPPTIFFHWHGETFDLPAGAELLASTKACMNQAFLLGDRVLGIQFHPEVTPEILRTLIEEEAWELVDAPYIQSAAKMLEGAEGLEESAGAGAAVAGKAGVAAGKAAKSAISFLIDWL
jgi:GMP synthase-like glutamine amidotransferase